MKLLHSYRLLRFTLVLSAILAQCVALGNFSLLVIAGALAVLSWFVTEGPRGKSVPPWIARLLVLVVFLYSIVDAFGPVHQLPLVLGQFVVWLTIIKLYGKRTVEHEAQLLLLSLLLMTVGALYATDFIFGLLLIVWSGFAAWVFLLYQLHQGLETLREERILAVLANDPRTWVKPVEGLQLNKVFRRTALLFLLVGLFGSMTIFIVAPREALEVLPDSMIARDSGLERIELNPDRDILQSTRQVMTVSLQDIFGKPVHMPQGLRLRGKVLDAYLGNGVWEAHMHVKSTIVTSDSEMTALTLTQTDRSTLLMEVVLQQPVNRIYSLYRTIALQTTPPSRVVMDIENSTMGLSLGSTPLQSYRVEVDFEKVVTSPFREKRYRYSNEAVHALALQLLLEAGVDVQEIQKNPIVNSQAAKVFETYLRSNEFTYTTDGSTLSIAERSALEEDDDPVSTFLFTYKSGHCEFFAAAMVAMCDTIDLPARIVTGFYVDRWDDVTSKYIVLERDAHAWVEVETDPMAWTTFDPTPLSLGSPTQQQAMTLTERIVYEWQQWEMAWATNVIEYDSLAQGKLLDYIDPYWRRHSSELTGELRGMYAWVVDWFDIGAGGRLWIDMVMGAMVLAGFATLIIRWKRRRTFKTLSFSHETQDRIPIASVEFYAKLQVILSRNGNIRPTFLPVQSWILSLTLEKEPLQLALSLTDTYYRIRFGGYRPTRVKRLQLMQTVYRFEQLVQRDAP